MNKKYYWGSVICRNWIIISLILLILTIWLTGTNRQLFSLINHYHYVLPDKVWLGLNLLSYVRSFILAIVLIGLTFFLRRDKLINVVVLVMAFYGVFYGLKVFIAEPRPYMVLPSGSFFWLNAYENAIRSAQLSFPSGHAGNMTVFALSVNYLFFAKHQFMRFVMLFLLFLTALARICTGWHWPMDVLGSILVAYLLVVICFSFDFNKILVKFKNSY